MAAIKPHKDGLGLEYFEFRGVLCEEYFPFGGYKYWSSMTESSNSFDE